MTDSQELDVLCYVLVVSIGLSILFNMNASSGGLDIVAKIMNKYLHIEMGKSYVISRDVCGNCQRHLCMIRRQLS